MNRITCPREDNIANAARTGRWDDSTRAHVKQCAHCREIAGITEWMGHIAGMDVQAVMLPDPGRVFLNAQMSALQRAREKALRPLAIAEFVVRIMVILALGAGVLWAWVGFRSLGASVLSASLGIPQAVLISAAALAACLVALLFIRLVQPILIEEW
jgi:hypothetical protein